jgi:hypothetical protein
MTSESALAPADKDGADDETPSGDGHDGDIFPQCRRVRRMWMRVVSLAALMP